MLPKFDLDLSLRLVLHVWFGKLFGTGQNPPVHQTTFKRITNIVKFVKFY